MADKIRITWDDVNSAAVDEHLRERDAAARAGEHFDQQASAGGFNWSNLLYNSLFYSAAFGLAGGFFAWLTSETILFVFSDAAVVEYREFGVEQHDIAEQRNSGEISQQEYERLRQELFARYAGNSLVKLERGGASDAELERAEGTIHVRSGIGILLFIGFVAVILTFFLAIGDPAMSRNWRGVIVNGSVGIAISLFSGVFGFCLTAWALLEIEQAVLTEEQQNSFIGHVLLRTVFWATFGGMLAIAPGVVLKNWKRLLIGLAGGVIGGTLGGLLFDSIGFLTQSGVPSRLVGFTAIGLITGLGTGVIEAVAKTGWLRVIEGLIAGKQFILYKNPTHIGSSPQCEIYLFKDPAVGPRHAAIHRVGGGFDIQDLSSQSGTLVNGRPVRRQRLKRGDRIQIGGTVFLFNERSRS